MASPVSLPPLTETPEAPAEPHSYEATFEAFEALPEGTRAEYIDGTIYMSPVPLPRHQDAVRNLLSRLDDYSREAGGVAYSSPIDVRLVPGARVIQPDVLFITADRVSIIGEKEIEGPPDLVMEVLSPSTAYLDLGSKRRACEEGGVQEYWVLDPAERSVEVFTLTDDGYQIAGRLFESGQMVSGALPGFTVDVADAFRRTRS